MTKIRREIRPLMALHRSSQPYIPTRRRTAPSGRAGPCFATASLGHGRRDGSENSRRGPGPALPYAHIFSRLLDLVLKLAVRHADSIS